ncbi:tyrosine-type recombinase/integrase [Rhodococcus koreensis]
MFTSEPPRTLLALERTQTPHHTPDDLHRHTAENLSARAEHPSRARTVSQPRGEPLSVDAIGQRLRTHVHRAALTCPELADTRITVRTLRHTAAMRFLAACIDTAVIALWFGHESTATTSIDLHADMDIKRRTLERTRQPDVVAGDYMPPDSLLAWLQSLWLCRTIHPPRGHYQ